MMKLAHRVTADIRAEPTNVLKKVMTRGAKVLKTAICTITNFTALKEVLKAIEGEIVSSKSTKSSQFSRVLMNLYHAEEHFHFQPCPKLCSQEPVIAGWGWGKSSATFTQPVHSDPTLQHLCLTPLCLSKHMEAEQCNTLPLCSLLPPFGLRSILGGCNGGATEVI